MNRALSISRCISILVCLAALSPATLLAENKSTGKSPKADSGNSSGRFSQMYAYDSKNSPRAFRWESAHQTSDGGFIMISSEAGAGIVIAKTTVAGKRIWERAFGYMESNLSTREYGHGSEVQETADGGFLATGQLDKFQSENLWVVRLDREGNTLWEKRYDGIQLGAKRPEEGGLGSTMVQNPDGSFLIGVRLSGGDYCILVKFDPAGVILWKKQFSDATTILTLAGSEIGRLANYRSIRLVRQGAGYLMAYNIREPTGMRKHVGIRLLRINENGDSTWSADMTTQAANIIKPMLNPMLNALTTTADGGFVVFGSQSGKGRAFVAKFSPDGNNQWLVSLGGTLKHGGGIVELAKGGFAVCATSEIYTAIALMFAKFSEADIVNGKGTVTEKRIYGIRENSVFACGSIDKTRDGGFILAGSHFIQYKGGSGWLIKVGSDGIIPSEPQLTDRMDQ